MYLQIPDMGKGVWLCLLAEDWAVEHDRSMRPRGSS